MSLYLVLALCFAIGIIAGLRSLTAPAVVCWATYFNWLNLQDSKLSFLDTTAALYISSTLALIELFADKQPWVGERTKPGPLVFRFITGGLSGAALSVSAGESMLLGAILGGVGGVAGGFAGYEARHRVVTHLKIPDIAVALVEDVVAIGGGFLIVSRFG